MAIGVSCYAVTLDVRVTRIEISMERYRQALQLDRTYVHCPEISGHPEIWSSEVLQWSTCGTAVHFRTQKYFHLLGQEPDNPVRAKGEGGGGLAICFDLETVIIDPVFNAFKGCLLEILSLLHLRCVTCDVLCSFSFRT